MKFRTTKDKQRSNHVESQIYNPTVQYKQSMVSHCNASYTLLVHLPRTPATALTAMSWPAITNFWDWFSQRRTWASDKINQLDERLETIKDKHIQTSHTKSNSNNNLLLLLFFVVFLFLFFFISSFSLCLLLDLQSWIEATKSMVS